jgi:CDP-paratose 2-epimerase
LTHIDRACGHAFNIGGGAENSLSLLELLTMLERITGVSLSYTRLPVRESDQRVFVADIAKAKQLLGWSPQVSAFEGVSAMVHWTAETLYGEARA